MFEGHFNEDEKDVNNERVNKFSGWGGGYKFITTIKQIKNDSKGNTSVRLFSPFSLP